MTDEELLKNRIQDLARQADNRHIYTSTHFLTPLEQSVFLSAKNQLPPITSRLYAPSESAIRKIVVFGSLEDLGYEFEDPIRILHIRPKAEKFAEELSHRDYLGSIMALGLEREMTGDIIIRGKEAWVYVLDTAAEYICENLTQIRKTQVICKEMTGPVPELETKFQLIKENIASERMDLFIAAATGLNREAGKKLLSEDKVFINGRPGRSAGHKLREGDEIVIRGYGKFIYDGIDATTKKGRLIIHLRKYL